MPSINKISNETLQKLKNKSIKGMAVNPSEKGASAKQVRDAMVEPYIGDNLSLATEVNRIVDEANEILGDGSLAAENELYYGNDEPDISKTWISDADLQVEEEEEQEELFVEEETNTPSTELLSFNVVDNTTNENTEIIDNTANYLLVVDNTN